VSQLGFFVFIKGQGQFAHRFNQFGKTLEQARIIPS
jgi:hypothetical protein